MTNRKNSPQLRQSDDHGLGRENTAGRRLSTRAADRQRSPCAFFAKLLLTAQHHNFYLWITLALPPPPPSLPPSFSLWGGFAVQRHQHTKKKKKKKRKRDAIGRWTQGARSCPRDGACQSAYRCIYGCPRLAASRPPRQREIGGSLPDFLVRLENALLLGPTRRFPIESVKILSGFKTTTTTTTTKTGVKPETLCPIIYIYIYPKLRHCGHAANSLSMSKQQQQLQKEINKISPCRK